MSESDFRFKAKTGDLLIFRGYECPAKCQRCFTGAHYDHVALLFKQNDVLFVYESTAKDGCMRRTWRQFIYNLWNLIYDKMVYRELRINMESKQKTKYEEELQKKCDEFINETQNKKYTLNCCAICYAKKREYERKNEWKQSEGFFCSQLVAAAYLKCDIIRYSHGTAQYLPGNFSHDKTSQLELQDNFSLGPEIILEFSE